jgi:excisionase family DNA binding protein
MATVPTSETPPPDAVSERLAYSVQEAADLLGVNYFSVYRMIVRGKLKVSRAMSRKLLVPRTELLKLLKADYETIINNSSRDHHPPQRRRKPTPQPGSVLPDKWDNSTPLTARFNAWNKT